MSNNNKPIYKINELNGISADAILPAILDAIDRGVSTDDIRTDPFKYLVSGETHEIVINTGGEGLKLSPEIIHEMAKRGDKLAQHIIDNDLFRKYNSSSFDKEEPLKFAYLERGYHADRYNKTLIEIIKEDKIHNTGGMNLQVCKVYKELWTYTVRKQDDHWSSEYIEGWHKVIAPLDDVNDSDTE